MFAACVDLEKVLDLMHHEALWDFLRLHWIFARTVALLSGLHSGTESAVQWVWVWGSSSFLPVTREWDRGVSSIDFQHVYISGIEQSFGSVIVEHLLATPVTDPDFAGDAATTGRPLEVLVKTLEALHEEKPLELSG